MIVGKKSLGVALALVLALVQVSQVFAAPAQDPLVGTVDTITVEGTGTAALVIVSYTDTDGYHHLVSLSLADAAALGLVSVDPVTLEFTGFLVGPGSPISLTGATFEELDACGTAEHPVGGALCSVFFPFLGASYEQIAAWHDAGFGFGVITQALFMAQKLGGDAAMADAILAAKGSGDYSALGYPDISNWGQFKKAVTAGDDKSMTNLGAVMSGRVQPPTLSSAATLSTTGESGNGHGKSGEHGKSGQHGKGK